MSKNTENTLCIPGQRLCASGPKCLASDGTYILNGFIYASQVGKVTTGQQDDRTLVKVCQFELMIILNLVFYIDDVFFPQHCIG